MKTIKSYTDLEQSKALIKILPLESADLKWFFWKEEIDAPKLPTFGYSKTAVESYKDTEAVYLPCWSLAALLEEIPEVINFDDDESDYSLEILKEGGLYYLSYGNPLEYGKIEIEPQDNFVDACVDMIEKLHEYNLL